MMRSARLALLAVAMLASPAGATFHVNTITEVMSGFGGDPNVQYVEIRMESGAQNLVANTRLTAFNADGTVANVLLLTPFKCSGGANAGAACTVGSECPGGTCADGVPNSQNKRRILYATSEYTAATGVTPDYTFPAGIFTPSGMVCWGAPSAIFAPDPTTWAAGVANPNNYIDCVAYGGYTGPTRDGTLPTVGSSGTPSALPPGDGTTALVRVSGSFNSGSNSTDFVLGVPGGCSNAASGCGDDGCVLMTAGHCGVLGGNGCPNGNLDAGEVCDDGNTVNGDSCRNNCTLPLTASQKACRTGIIKGSIKYSKTYTQLLAKCDEAVLIGKISGPCPDSPTAEKLSDAADKLEAAIQKACPNGTPSGVRYGATCPGFGNQCQTPIAGFSDVSDCVACVHARFGDQLENGLYGQFASGSDALKKCQKTIGKVINKYYQARYKLDAKCEQEILDGKRDDEGICADPYLDDFKFGSKFTKLLNNAGAGICKACGGADKACGGGDDFTPATIGYSTCPAPVNAKPPATDCQLIAITNLDSLNGCLLCLAVGSEPDCAQVVATRPDQVPAKCNPTPAATPTPTVTPTP